MGYEDYEGQRRRAHPSRAPTSVSHFNKSHERLRAGSSWEFGPAQDPIRKNTADTS